MLRLKLTAQELARCQCKLRETQEKLAVEREAVAAGEEKLQKLERRLIFVTKAS